jgi:hypothetical protein
VAKEIWIERAPTKKLQEKHADVTAELISFDFGPHKIRIHARIPHELLEGEEAQAIEAFEELCLSFSEVCSEHHIKFAPVDVFILANDELSRGTSTKFRDADDGDCFAEILIPASDFKMHEFWKYTFLRELAHSWLSVEFSPKDREFGYHDLFVDLVVLCTFRKILPPARRVYREVRRHRTYFLNQQTKRFLGKELYKQILQDPEAYLRDLRQRM